LLAEPRQQPVIPLGGYHAVGCPPRLPTGVRLNTTPVVDRRRRPTTGKIMEDVLDDLDLGKAIDTRG
jgi:hypothetical protein